MTSDAAAIEFRLLGSVEAGRGGKAVPLGGPRQRALLALLLLEPGRPMPADRLVDELWQGQPPAGAAATLQTYVSRLRRALGSAAAITSGASGYALDAHLDHVDAKRFERLAREGRAALARGAAERAAERFQEALGLWRGPPFAGLDGVGALRLEASRLEEVRLDALTGRIDAELALGRGAELVDELEALVREHPYRERLWQLLMLALYRAQRQADALAAYRRARTLLGEELGLEPSDELRRLQQAILRQEVPEVRPQEQRHDLPTPVSNFLGRATELADIERLLGESRLVTLTGVGGVGKTRLALEAARRALPDFPGGVFFVDCSPLAEATLVARHVATELGVREQADVPLATRLATHLGDAELLLVLDNCEHLRESCAELAVELLAACPSLRVLATSREVLAVAGEVDYAVAPFAPPAADAGQDELRSSEAVRLFLTRAREARPGLDESHALTSAAEICRELDGIPLAIELAAARAKALSPEEIAARLVDRFRFLVAWRRVAPARHRTLRAAMDWSYGLLGGDDQRLLAQLSVFAGGFTLDAAAGVCLDGDEERALELVGRLVDASLVVPEEGDGRMRYRLLETVRQYAAERLDERGETAAARHRHAEHYVAVLQREVVGVVADLDRWVEARALDYANVRAALTWSRDTGEPEYLLRLVNPVWRFWWVRGELSEGRSWLDAALERGVGLDPALRADAYEGAAGLAWAHGDLARASELADAGRRLYAEIGDSRGEGSCANVLGLVAQACGELSEAEAFFTRSRDLYAQVADERLRTTSLAVAALNLAGVAFEQGALARAARRYEAALSLYLAAHDSYGAALCELFLGHVAVEAGRVDDAAGHLRRALPVFRQMGFRQYAAQCLEGVAAVVHARGAARETATLLAAADASRDRTGNQAGRMHARLRERLLASLRADLGDELEAATAEARALAEDAALDRAQRALS